MDRTRSREKGKGSLSLPAPPPTVPTDAKPEPINLEHNIISRPSFGSSGYRTSLFSNHFEVSIEVSDAIFYMYSVDIFFEDNRPVEVRGIKRKIIDKLYKIYPSALAGKIFAYDGERSLYTVGPLPQDCFRCTVELEESFAKRDPVETSKRSKQSFRSKTFNVDIRYSAKIPLRDIAGALRRTEAPDALRVLDAASRVLDAALRQQAANRGCLLVRQSFFQDDPRKFRDVGGGVSAVQGFHSSFSITQRGLCLNADLSTTVILKGGSVLDFLLENQNVREPQDIDWIEAKRTLQNLRVEAAHSQMQYKIVGLSKEPCNRQFFSMKVNNSPREGRTVDITVYEYFTRNRRIELTWSASLPCLDVGKPRRPCYLPLELCSFVTIQRYNNALSSAQRASLVEISREKPQRRVAAFTEAVKNYSYDLHPFLSECGISIEQRMTQVNGRVLRSPTLIFGRWHEFGPSNGRWNFNSKTLLEAADVGHWIVVNFSASFSADSIADGLIKCARRKEIPFRRPETIIEEDRRYKTAAPVERVERMFEKIKGRVSRDLKFILCILREPKNSDIYGPWKKKCLCDSGIFTQCISPTRINDQYLTNVLLKINAKLGGLNFSLRREKSAEIPLIQNVPTMILGMDVSHGPPGRAHIPSIAAVVGSQYWPLISKYRAYVRTQSPRTEMIDALHKPSSDGTRDDGIMGELLLDFYGTSKGYKPEQIIIFRDGVSESQFNQVLNIELEQIKKAYLFLDNGRHVPKFTVIVVQKNHHTKLFQASARGEYTNVPPGTVVDRDIVHPRNYDFYLCAHLGIIGTSKPAHYHVLLDEIGFSVNQLQEFVHSLSYVFQRSTTAISIVAPVQYAHLAALQMSKFVKFEDFSETSQGQTSRGQTSRGQTSRGQTSRGQTSRGQTSRGQTSRGQTSRGETSEAQTDQIPQLPLLHNNVADSMFFC